MRGSWLFSDEFSNQQKSRFARKFFTWFPGSRNSTWEGGWSIAVVDSNLSSVLAVVSSLYLLQQVVYSVTRGVAEGSSWDHFFERSGD